MIKKKILKNELSEKRWKAFKKKKISYWCLWVLLALLFVSLTAEFWANSKPIVLSYKNSIYFPILKKYHPSVFGREDSFKMDYRSLDIKENGWAIWPLIKWDPLEKNENLYEFPSKPSDENILGTDEGGRDLLARLIYGFRYSFTYGFGVWFFVSLLGTLFGSLMGYFGGKVDLVGQRIVEIFESMPYLLILLTMISIFFPGIWLLVLLTSFLTWMGVGHYIRGEMLKLRKREFVEAARSQGASVFRILFKHCIPNGLTPWITLSPFLISQAILSLAILDYLGFGVPAPTPSWGELLNQSKKHFTIAWWLALYPSLALFITLAVLNSIGEGVRSAFDPRG